MLGLKVYSPSKIKRSNRHIQFNPPVKVKPLPVIDSLKGRIILPNKYSINKSFIVGNYNGNKVVPDLLGGNFGWSVDCNVNGEYTVVGGPSYNSMMGYAKIYKVDMINNSYRLLYTTIEQQVLGNMIGFCVSISGNGSVVAVGMPGYNGNSGGVLIYNIIKDVVSYKTFIDPPGGVSGRYAGQTLKLSYDGSIIAIGAPLYNSNVGIGWIYKNVNNNWSLVQTLNNPDVGNTYYFGDVITMIPNANKIVISGRQQLTGEVYFVVRIYNYVQGSNWVLSNLTTGITVDTNLLINNVECDVKLSSNGNIIFVSTPIENGFVYALFMSNDILQRGSLITHSNSYSGFGYKICVSQDGNTIYVSSVTDDSGEGSIWMYRQSEINTGTWLQTQQSFRGKGDIGQPQQGFSIACSYDGQSLIIGGPFDNSNKGSSWTFI